jgi:hypothetical protein
MVDVITLIPPILAIIVGLVILIWPKVLNIVVALYFLIVGILGLLAALGVFVVKVPALAILSLI